MGEIVHIDEGMVHDLQQLPFGRVEHLDQFAREVLAVANDLEYQRLVREMLLIPADQVDQKADAMIVLSNYAYALDQPPGHPRDSVYVSAAFKVVTKALIIPRTEPHA